MFQTVKFVVLLAAFEPEVSVTVPRSISPSVYRNLTLPLPPGVDRAIEVEVGRGFDVLCSSSGRFPGMAVWYRLEDGGMYTVEPLNNVTFGTSYSVQVTLFIIERFLSSEVINLLALL